jgi:hypothetical protein
MPPSRNAARSVLTARCKAPSVTVTPGQSASNSSSLETTRAIVHQINEQIEYPGLERNLAPHQPESPAGSIELKGTEFEVHEDKSPAHSSRSAKNQEMLRRA